VSDSEKRFPCPHCQAPILEGARKCRACRLWLSQQHASGPRFPRAGAIVATGVSTVLAVLISGRQSTVGEAPPLTPLPADAKTASMGAPAPAAIGPEPEVEPERKPIDPNRPWRSREIRIGDVHPLDIVWNPNGKSIYVSADDATLREYRIKSGELVHQASVPAQGDHIRLLFDRYIAVLRHTDAARIPVMDTQTWDRDPILLHIGASPGDIIEMPDGHTVVAASTRGKRVMRFSLPTGKRLADITLPHATGQLFLLRAEQRPYLAAMGALTHQGQPAGAWVDLFDPAEGPFGATRRSISVGRDPRPGAVTADGGAVFFPDRVSNTAVLLKVAAVTEARQVAVGQGPTEGFLLHDDRYGITINTAAQTASVVSLATMEMTGTLRLRGVPCSGETTPDKKLLFVSLGGASFPPKGSGMAVIGGDPPKVMTHLPTGKGACAVSVSRDGTRAAVANYHGKSITILEQ
jgi:DNA-binding beta-propeller fold protein YncE